MSQPVLKLIDDIPASDVPQDIQRIGTEAIQAIWVSACRIMEEQNNKFKAGCEQRELEIKEKHQNALETVDRMTKEIAALKSVIEGLEREKKALISHLDRKTGEAEAFQRQLHSAEEHGAQQDHEIRRLAEELGRSREHAEGLQKQSDDLQRQAKQDQLILRQAQEENAAHQRTVERLEEQIKGLGGELDKTRDRLRVEHGKATAAESLAEEVKSNISRYEIDLKNLKTELQDRRESLDGETKLRAEAERKLAMIGTQLEAQERTQREIVSRLEQELSASKAELATLRNRVIKSEGALEREKKAVERLETRLAVLAGGKP